MAVISDRMIVGEARIPQEIVDDAVQHLIKIRNGDNRLTRTSSGRTYEFSYMNVCRPGECQELNDSPFEKLIIMLLTRISEIGIECLGADFVFELGAFDPINTRWHLDGRLYGDCFSICYSNKKNWSTRIADPHIAEKILNITQDLWSKDLAESLRYASGEDIKKLDEHSLPSEMGCFYNPCEIPHRSPMLEDFSEEEQKLSPNDYRLFIRLSER